MQEFTLPEIPKHTELQKKVYRMAKNDSQLRQCHATKENGSPCRCKAMTFEVFCHSHLAQGYGLFTLAVVAQVGTVKIQRMENN